MIENQSIITIFNELRSGNDTALDGLIITEDKFSKKGKFLYTQTKIRNSDLEGMIVCSFKDFKYERKDRKKKGKFNGQLNEVYSIYSNELMALVNDRSFQPKDNAELCSKLKYNANKAIEMELVPDVPLDSLNSIRYSANNDSDDISISPVDKVSYQEWTSKLYDDSGGYIGLFRELLRIERSTDINNLFPVNSDFQKRLIDIFMNDTEVFCESGDTHTIKTMKDIAKIYNKHFNQLPAEEQIIEAMNSIYERLMRCAVGYVYCTRAEFNRKNDDDKRKPPSKGCYCLKNIYQMLSYPTEQIIERVNKRDYQIADREYCNAYDLLIERIKASAKLLKSKGFNVDIELMTNITLFNYSKNEYWNFSEDSKGDYKIEFYNELESSVYSLRRAKKIKYSSLPCCYIIGNCVIYADTDTKTLTYLQKENRLFYVKKSDNKYLGYKINC